MERTQELFKKIERYLAKELNSQEQIDFELEINANSDLKQEVELHRDLQLEMENIESLEFRKKLVDISDLLQNKKQKLFSWRIAAIIVALIGLGTFLTMNSLNSNENLFDNYYSLYPVEDNLRGGTTGKFDNALENYSKGNFDKAISELEELVVQYPDGGDLKMYLGNSYLQTYRTQQAIDIFSSITEESNLYENSQWYLALAHLRSGNTSEVVRYLEVIRDYNGLHSKSSKNLLNELKD